MNGMMVSSVHIKVALSRKQPNMGDANFRPRPGLGTLDTYCCYILQFTSYESLYNKVFDSYSNYCFRFQRTQQRSSVTGGEGDRFI